MAHDKVYVKCENKCDVEGLSKSQILELYRNGFTHFKNAKDGTAMQIWVGSRTELPQERSSNTIYVVTDDPLPESLVTFKTKDVSVISAAGEKLLYITDDDIDEHTAVELYVDSSEEMEFLLQNRISQYSKSGNTIYFPLKSTAQVGYTIHFFMKVIRTTNASDVVIILPTLKAY